MQIDFDKPFRFTNPAKPFLALLCALFSATVVQGASIPNALVGSEIDRIVEVIGFGAVSRVHRSAESYDSWPGVKVGLEIGIFGGKEINLLGNGNGSLPGTNPVPRVYIAKGLFSKLELILNFLPAGSPNGATTSGAILKWNFYKEASGPIALAAFLGYTKVKGFDLSYDGSDAEFGVYASKDFVRLKPYLGVGTLFAQGAIPAAYAKTAKMSAMQTTFHFFIGAEFELPVTLSAQIDMMNLNLAGSVLFGKRF